MDWLRHKTKLIPSSSNHLTLFRLTQLFDWLICSNLPSFCNEPRAPNPFYFQQIINLSFIFSFSLPRSIKCNVIHYSDIYDYRYNNYKMVRSSIYDVEGPGDVQLCLWSFRQSAGMKQIFGFQSISSFCKSLLGWEESENKKF